MLSLKAQCSMCKHQNEMFVGSTAGSSIESFYEEFFSEDFATITIINKDSKIYTTICNKCVKRLVKYLKLKVE